MLYVHRELFSRNIQSLIIHELFATFRSTLEERHIFLPFPDVVNVLAQPVLVLENNKIISI